MATSNCHYPEGHGAESVLRTLTLSSTEPSRVVRYRMHTRHVVGAIEVRVNWVSGDADAVHVLGSDDPMGVELVPDAPERTVPLSMSEDQRVEFEIFVEAPRGSAPVVVEYVVAARIVIDACGTPDYAFHMEVE